MKATTNGDKSMANGNLKSEEFYVRGLEEGTMYDYNEDGAKIKEYKYVKGLLIKETKLVP